MPTDKKQQPRDLSKYDGMRMDELRECIKRDGPPGGEGALPMEELVYILEVMEKRERETGVQQPGQSYEEFKENTLLPHLARRRQSTPLPAAGNEEPHRRRGTTLLRRVLATAAVLLLLVSLSSVVAYAVGYDPFGIVAGWGDGSFWLDRREAEPQSVRARPIRVPPQLSDMAACMEAHQIPTSLLPTYLPEGYEAVEEIYKADEMDTGYRYVVGCRLDNGEYFLFLDYSIYYKHGTVWYEMDEDIDPVIYDHNGYRFYIFTNADTYDAVFAVGDDIEAHIGVSKDHDLLYTIIDSIQ